MSIKLAQKLFHYKNDRFWHLYKNCLRMWEFGQISLLPKALKTCPKSNKSPNLVTLVACVICSAYLFSFLKNAFFAASKLVLSFFKPFRYPPHYNILIGIKVGSNWLNLWLNQLGEIKMRICRLKNIKSHFECWSKWWMCWKACRPQCSKMHLSKSVKQIFLNGPTGIRTLDLRNMSLLP